MLSTRICSMEKEIDKLQQAAAKKGNKPVSCLREVNAKLDIVCYLPPPATVVPNANLYAATMSVILSTTPTCQGNGCIV